MDQNSYGGGGTCPWVPVVISNHLNDEKTILCTCRGPVHCHTKHNFSGLIGP